jgi:glycosyltransferase involved in cell wall biosynthesis
MVMKATAIVPAYNEALRIAPVLAAITGAESIGEVIVVDDGSRDRTAEAAAQPGVTVVRLPEPGKAQAMCEGRSGRERDHRLPRCRPGRPHLAYADDGGRCWRARWIHDGGPAWSGSPLVTA